MKENIDDDSYNLGRSLFSSGASMRSIIEQGLVSNNADQDDKTFSVALGFVDAMFDVVRGAFLK